MTAPRILLASPIPSHPADQGNAARITCLGRWLQARGAQVEFLYYALEGISPAQHEALCRCWDGVHVVPVRPFSLAPRADGSHGLDDWYDPAVSERAAALHAARRYTAIIANYVWFSAILTALPGSVLKILDTHDVFGGRDAVFRAAGLEPAWFWTTPEQEGIGLARADLVLAIQDQEAAILRTRTRVEVRVLGHLPPWRRRLPRAGPPTAGYLASRNPINQASFAALRNALVAGDGGGWRLVVAGAICDTLTDPAPFTAIGRVRDTGAFYDQVDLVLNPMGFGTGLKIKSVEALFEDVPLLATRAAMEGLPVRHPLHALEDAPALATALATLAGQGGAALDALRFAGRDLATRYAASVRASREALWRTITGDAQRP